MKRRRISILIEEVIYETLKELARRSGTSMSLAARDLLRESIESFGYTRLLKARQQEQNSSYDRAKH